MSNKNTEREQTLGEEIVNAITHGIGALLALGCFGTMVAFAAIRENAYLIVSAALYGLMMFLMYMSSTLYHAAVSSKMRRVLNVFDHNAIYLMIAGSYTPFCLGPLRQYQPGWGWAIFGTIWGLAIVGIVFQSCFINRYRALSTLTYVLMGWVVVIAIYPLWHAVGPMSVLWIGVGGLFYTLGVIFYAWNSLKYAHAVWHLFVLAGSITHFFVILFKVML